MPDVRPAYLLGARVRGPVASPPLDPCADDMPPWAQREPRELLTQRTLDLVRPYWLTGSAAHYAIIHELCTGYAATMAAVLDELPNLFSTLKDIDGFDFGAVVSRKKRLLSYTGGVIPDRQTDDRHRIDIWLQKGA